jgi:hypothetical protein
VGIGWGRGMYHWGITLHSQIRSVGIPGGGDVVLLVPRIVPG